jgi:hypothetical protein
MATERKMHILYTVPKKMVVRERIKCDDVLDAMRYAYAPILATQLEPFLIKDIEADNEWAKSLIDALHELNGTFIGADWSPLEKEKLCDCLVETLMTAGCKCGGK